MHVQQLLRNYLILFRDREDHIGVLGKMLDRLLGYVSGKLDRKYLVHVLDHNSGVSYYQIKIRQSLFYFVDPLYVYILMYCASF